MTAVAVPVPLAGDATRQSKGEIPRESVADAGAGAEGPAEGPEGAAGAAGAAEADVITAPGSDGGSGMHADRASHGDVKAAAEVDTDDSDAGKAPRPLSAAPAASGGGAGGGGGAGVRAGADGARARAAEEMSGARVSEGGCEGGVGEERDDAPLLK